MDLINNIKEKLDSWTGDYLGLYIPDITLIDVIEMIIIAFVFYRFLVWCKNSRAWTLLKGILIIVLVFVLAAILQMSTILWLGERLLSVALIAVVILFQPELRKALDGIGSRSLSSMFRNIGLGKAGEKRFTDRTLNDMVKASYEMGAVKTGALIVIENQVKLNEYERTGIRLDSLLSSQLLINIFEKNTPLHDGAVIVEGDRVVAATCYLPISDSNSISKDLGTRHRAALGISEATDATTIIVSEETGKVSLTHQGKLIHDISPEDLTNFLRSIQQPEEVDEDGKDKGKTFLRRRSGHEE
ncbi:MAG: diadenylate cyclase CdaA [Lachnospiraceae bacterium]|nr:diadenylate cyclase CdaA [Lachnospiraceae bacterium]